MNINLSKKNALGRVFWSLPKSTREQIFFYAEKTDRRKSRNNFRQYFFINAKSNPKRIDPQIKAYMIEQCDKFTHCFVPNSKVNIALEILAET